MTALFSQLFKDALNEYAYDAEIAGLKYYLSNTLYGINVSLLYQTLNHTSGRNLVFQRRLLWSCLLKLFVQFSLVYIMFRWLSWSSGVTCISSGKFKSWRDQARAEAACYLLFRTLLANVKHHTEDNKLPNHCICIWGGLSVTYHRSEVFPRVHPFPLPVKLTATTWPKIVKVGLNANQ